MLKADYSLFVEPAFDGTTEINLATEAVAYLSNASKLERERLCMLVYNMFVDQIHTQLSVMVGFNSMFTGVYGPHVYIGISEFISDVINFVKSFSAGEYKDLKFVPQASAILCALISVVKKIQSSNKLCISSGSAPTEGMFCVFKLVSSDNHALNSRELHPSSEFCNINEASTGKALVIHCMDAQRYEQFLDHVSQKSAPTEEF